MKKRITNWLLEKANESLPEELLQRLEQVPVHATSEAGFDEFGFNPEHLKIFGGPMLFMYEKWFRAEVYGISHVPLDGPALIIGNHSGQLPLDGALIAIACMMEMEKPRLPRAMIEKWFPTVPGLNIFFSRVGQVVGIMENAEKLLDNGEIVMIFPEGIRGSGKTWDKRYQLQRFTVGFMELAIRYSAPIIPVGVIGGEEQAPAFVDYKPLAKAIGMPYFPITPTFPWLGALGFVPYPSKYHLLFGEPFDFSDRKEDLPHPDRIRKHVDLVRDTIQDMVNEGLKERLAPGL